MNYYTFFLLDGREVTYAGDSEALAFNKAYAAHGAAVTQEVGRYDGEVPELCEEGVIADDARRHGSDD